MNTFDVIIAGGGPAGSTCARFLVKGGLKVAILDKSKFPRVKLCAGWMTPQVWDILGISSSSYPKSLWSFNRAHLHFGKHDYCINNITGFFIRRYEFDEYLLQMSKASVFEQHVKEIEYKDGFWIIDQSYKARYLVGAGGTNCPVAKLLFPKKLGHMFSCVEKEFEHDPVEIQASMAGKDGEPEMFMHGNLVGYSWNIPKTEYINMGAGTLTPQSVLKKWKETISFFQKKGHLPQKALSKIEKVTGHVFYGFNRKYLDSCYKNGAFLAGDALGLANPCTGEGIAAAILSGKLCAKAISANNPEIYQTLLSQHPLIRDYKIFSLLINFILRINSTFVTRLLSFNRLLGLLICNTFAWIFTGQHISGARIKK